MSLSHIRGFDGFPQPVPLHHHPLPRRAFLPQHSTFMSRLLCYIPLSLTSKPLFILSYSCCDEKIHRRKQFKEGKSWGKQRNKRPKQLVTVSTVGSSGACMSSCSFPRMQSLSCCVWHKINICCGGGVLKVRVWHHNVRKKSLNFRQLLDAFLKNSGILQVPRFVVLKNSPKVPSSNPVFLKALAAALLGSPRLRHRSCLLHLQSRATLTCCRFCLINRCWYDSTSL